MIEFFDTEFFGGLAHVMRVGAVFGIGVVALAVVALFDW